MQRKSRFSESYSEHGQPRQHGRGNICLHSSHHLLRRTLIMRMAVEMSMAMTQRTPKWRKTGRSACSAECALTIAQISPDRIKKFNSAVESKSRVCPECSLQRADHYAMLNHIVGYHKDLARACIPHRCEPCSTAFKSAEAEKRHDNSCKNKDKSQKRKAEEQLAGEQKKPKQHDSDTKCCGYTFSGRRWNLERHKRTRHGVGNQVALFSSHMCA